MRSKRILTRQDLSCVGQCSLTVARPVLSAYGVETCALPTAILSNHTAFEKWSCLDLTPEMNHIMAAWRENGFKFDAFLLGYLGSADIMNIAKVCFRDFAADGAQIIIDPVFGDNGKLYPAFDKGYVAALADLIESADIILLRAARILPSSSSTEFINSSTFLIPRFASSYRAFSVSRG